METTRWWKIFSQKKLILSSLLKLEGLQDETKDRRCSIWTNTKINPEEMGIFAPIVYNGSDGWTSLSNHYPQEINTNKSAAWNTYLGYYHSAQEIRFHNEYTCLSPSNSLPWTNCWTPRGSSNSRNYNTRLYPLVSWVDSIRGLPWTTSTAKHSSRS